MYRGVAIPILHQPRDYILEGDIEPTTAVSDRNKITSIRIIGKNAFHIVIAIICPIIVAMSRTICMLKLAQIVIWASGIRIESLARHSPAGGDGLNIIGRIVGGAMLSGWRCVLVILNGPMRDIEEDCCTRRHRKCIIEQPLFTVRVDNTR